MKQMPLRLRQRGGIFVRYMGLNNSYYSIEHYTVFYIFANLIYIFVLFKIFAKRIDIMLRAREQGELLMKTTWKTMNGSIYSPNHIGHELIICQQLDGQSTNVAFSPIRHDGYDYLIAKIYYNGELDTLREALLKIREVATPLPIRTLTTVRIPHLMGCAAVGDDWSAVSQLIQEELLNHNIPVEIWNERKEN